MVYLNKLNNFSDEKEIVTPKTPGCMHTVK